MNAPTRFGHLPGLIADYYDQRLAQFGATARGVDWRDEQSQELRFAQLARCFPTTPFDICEVGCGYGALYDHMRKTGLKVDRYEGIDVSTAMVECARKRHPGDDRFRARVGTRPLADFDVCVASGVFNVRVGTLDDDWTEWVLDGIDGLNRHSRQAFAFNLLSHYADVEKMSGHLYYADPLFFFDLCKQRYGRDVSLLHDYGLFEFTLVVRKGHPPVGRHAR